MAACFKIDDTESLAPDPDDTRAAEAWTPAAALDRLRARKAERGAAEGFDRGSRLDLLNFMAEGLRVLFEAAVRDGRGDEARNIAKTALELCREARER